MNKHASNLGKLAKGVSKTKTDAGTRARRLNLAKGRDRLAAIRAERKESK